MAFWHTKQEIARLEKRVEQTEQATTRANRKRQKEEEATSSKEGSSDRKRQKEEEATSSKEGPSEERDAKYFEKALASGERRITDFRNGDGHFSGGW
jgi:hypothetical protein